MGAQSHPRDLIDLRRNDRLEHLQLLVAQPIRVEGRRRLHRQQRQQLEHVVLDQVAERAGALVVAGAPPDPYVLGGSDLNVIDVVAVPDRLEQDVGEPQCHQVLDRLLAQVVVDAEDLRLLEDLEQLGIELACRSEVVAERLLDHDPRARVLDRVEAGGAELAGDQREELRRGRQVEDAVERPSGLLVELGQCVGELVVDPVLVE